MGTVSGDRAARGNAVARWLLLFLVSAVAGWVYEMVFYYVDQGGVFIRRGNGFGPWLPIYGCGAVLICLAARRFRSHPIQVLLVSGSVAGLVEFCTGWVLYHCFGGLRLWDYNTEIWNWGNIGGFVCIRSVAVFAVAGVVAVYCLQPAIWRLAARSGNRRFRAAVFSAFAVFVLDVLWGYVLTGLQ